jgi:ABC-2 type transport system ATP-binding protein
VPVVEVTDLVKTYGDVDVVSRVDLTIESGQVFALLGPNGAGKTTTVEILEGHRTPTSGTVSVLGRSPQESHWQFRDRIGIVLQETAIERELTVREALAMYGSMYSKRRPADELIELVGLEEKARARVKTLSGGQQRRLELALGLVGDPDLIFMDEPTTGFDPSARRQAWSVLENLADLGKTILLTTHYMDEAQYLADQIAVISKGVIVAEGTPDTLGGRAEAEAVVRFTLPHGVDASDLPIDGHKSDGRAIEMRSPSPTRLLQDLTTWALSQGVELDNLSVTRPSLEDVYLELVGDDDE